ncbi:MAG TPA: VWA domain-containing protein [Dehalococcoidia bacterium]|nr:VWA domain-containing protein [Dehalococcoidia bacterium]
MPAKDIEAIIDDSGSMALSDENRLRVQGLDLLMNIVSPSTQLGAVEFGSEADTVFPPLPVGPNMKTMQELLDQKIQADNGTTNYNAAFAQSDADNPGADARIFLTDGGHNEGTYNEGHLVHRVPTYVIGFSPGLALPEDQERLKKIANDTGTQPYSLEDSSQLQSVMNSIGAALTCQTPPRTFTDQLAQGQSKSHNVAIGAATRSVQIALTWASPLDKFKLLKLRLVSGSGQTLAVASARRHKPGKLKVTTTTSSTFTLIKVSRLRKGKLRFSVKGAKVASGPKAILTTQVTQARKSK